MEFSKILQFRAPREQPSALVAETMAKLGELTASSLASAAAAVHPNPSEAQKESGNYRKGHISWKGLDIAIETAAGQKRKPEWPALKHHYGYFKRTDSKADGDPIDVFVNPEHLDSEIVFVVNQNKQDGSFDEHKVIVGCHSEDEARKTYLANYSPGWKGLGSIKAMTLEQFKNWLEKGDTAKKAADKKIPLPLADRIGRDAFLYLEPVGDGDDFAQCGTCSFFGKDHCALFTKDFTVAAEDSCGVYVPGKPLGEDTPALDLLSPEEAGFVRRQVRCENCYHGGSRTRDGEEEHYCKLYANLNKQLPDIFDLKEVIRPKACCNAQTPSPEKEALDCYHAKEAADYAPGLPRRDNFGDLSRLEAGKFYDFVTQRHEAHKAGPHTDIRFGSPELGLYSWASRHGLPGVGERRLAVAQPVHRHGYRDFEGEIPSGYGAGTVKKEQSGQILLTKVTPHEIHFTTGHGRYPERFVLLKTHQRPRDWLMVNTTPTALPPVKNHFVKVPAHEVEGILKNLKPGSSVQPKLDGASHVAHLLRDGVELLSYRPSRVTGGPILQTERILGHRPHGLKIPSELVGTMLNVETYGMRGGKAIPPAELGGLLNASLTKSLVEQKAQGIQLKNLVHGVQRLGRQDIDWNTVPLAERQQMMRQVLQHLPQDAFHLPEEATTPETALKLWKQIHSGQHPLTYEGVVIHPPTGKPMKVKPRPEHDVHIRSIFPGEGKLQGIGAGGFHYSHEPEGPVVGKVGTGLSESLRRELHQSPQDYIGRIARVAAQERLPSGALRAPSFLAFHEDYDPAAPSPASIKLAAVPEKGNPFTIAVDLDGTIFEAEEPFDPKTVGKLRKKVKKHMLAFHKAGARLIIFTVRGDESFVRRKLKEHGVPFHFINENPDQPPGSSGKVFAHAYWDDRGWNALDPDEHGPRLLEMAKEHAQEKAAADCWLVTPDELLEALACHAAFTTETSPSLAVSGRSPW